MNIAFIGCMVMSREIGYETFQSKNMVHTWWLQQGLHDTPKVLTETLQKTIDEVEKYNSRMDRKKRFDYICLGYGLCSNGVVGIHSNTIPLIIPRCDDCIALFLGSQARYQRLFHKYAGVYWYNTGWIEQAFTPSKQRYEQLKEKYLEKYDEETVEYLMEKEIEWVKKYKYSVYIESPLCRREEHEIYAREAAEAFGWRYKKEKGDMTLFHGLLNGPWPEEYFLACPPEHEVCAEYSERKIKAIPWKNR